MKKILYIIILLLLALTTLADKIDKKEYDAQRQACYQALSSNCVKKIMNRYPTAPRAYTNVLYYDLALAYEKEKDYVNSMNAINYILMHENENRNLLKETKELKGRINELYEKMRIANNMDAGDYYNKNEKYYKWQKPYNIKVYITPSLKTDIFKTAFKIWDDALFSTVNFTYVQSENDANIVVKYVDSIPNNIAGYMKPINTTAVGVQNYYTKVEIISALKRPDGTNYTDINLLSIALHEIGHALGLYHSDNINDVMYYSTASYKNTTISRRDVNTVKRIYR